jgi:hypothetical protein
MELPHRDPIWTCQRHVDVANHSMVSLLDSKNKNSFDYKLVQRMQFRIQNAGLTFDSMNKWICYGMSEEADK